MVYLQHHGVKGMKWGVRRYQNKDGSLTTAGKKRLVRDITSKKTNWIDAKDLAKNASNSDSALAEWRKSKSYEKFKHAKTEYTTAKQKYLDAHDKVWRGVLDEVEKKHGRYEDIMRSGDKEKQRKFDADYNPLLNKRFKESGVYELEKQKDVAYEAFENARETYRNDTRQFIESYLGADANKPLRGQGSAIYRGREIVDRVKTSDIFVDMFDERWH